MTTGTRPKTADWVGRARQNLGHGLSPLHGFSGREILAAQSAFSAFSDVHDVQGFVTGSALLIRALHTPRPYLHLMSSLHSRERGIYGSFWDQTGRGFSCLDSVLAGPVTAHTDPSYVPTCPGDTDYRAFYLCEWRDIRRVRRPEETPSDVWHLLPQPGRDEFRYRAFECLQGLGEMRIGAVTRRISASVSALVAADDPVELWTIVLHNRSDQPRRLTLFTRVNWGLRSYPGYYFDMRVVCRGVVDPARNAIAAFNDDHNNKHPRSGLLMSDTPIQGHDLSREAFDGDGVARIFPRAVREGRCTGSMGNAPLAGLIGAIQQELRLGPGETRTIRTLVGACSADSRRAARERERWRRRYLTGDGVEREIARVRRLWADRCSANTVRSGDAEIDRFFNVWSKYQAHHQSRFVRALDMMGYRDILQDLLGICDFDAAYVRGALLTALSFQLPDGRAIRQYCKFAGAGHDVRMYMDSPVWIADTLVTYIQETGDFGILDEKVGFFDMAAGRVRPDPSASVWDHALLAIRSCYEFRGQKGLCLAGHGDWNDALDGIGRGGRGVSVWLSAAVVFAAARLRELAVRLGRERQAVWLATVCRTLTRAVNRQAWDGRHYIYGFNDSGQPVGSDCNREGKIHLNVNTWSVLAGIAQAYGGDRTERVLKSIERLRTPIGYLLLTPPYTAKSRRVGRIADMLPGLFENGSVYTHGQAFVAAAMVTLGRGDEAWEALKMTMPSHTPPGLATTPPNQQSNFTVGRENADFGVQYYSNFSGSLDWYRRTLIRIFGVMADFDGLRISPCVPRWMKTYAVRKRFRGCEYVVTVRNTSGRGTHPRSIAVDGKPIRSVVVPLSPRTVCRVDVDL